MPSGALRFFQIFNAAIFGLIFLAGIPMMIAGKVGAGLGFMGFALVIGGFIVGLFELQLRQRKKMGVKIKATMEAVARTLFDQPEAVRPGYDVSVTMSSAMATMAAGWDANAAFTTSGVHRGVRVSSGSHYSAAGRQMGEFGHVYSYVCVDVLGATERFVLAEQGVGSKLFTAVGVMRDAQVGDPAFDKTFTVDMDPALAKDVFESPALRAKLMELRSKVGMVSQDFGAGRMHFILTGHGLAVRWPGELDPAFAVWLRDLLLEMRAGILAHLDKRAHAGAGQGYRVASDAAGPAVEEQVAMQQEIERARARS